MSLQITKLSLLPMGCYGIILSINASDAEKQRFIDLGFAPTLKVGPLFKSPAQDPAAYEVMGAVLALRSEDASRIIVRQTDL